jgi:endonuclease YncB( thermonuclease family)
MPATGDETPALPHREPPQPKQVQKRDWLTLDPGKAAPEDMPAPVPGTHALARWQKGKVRFHGWSGRLSDRLKASAILNGGNRMAGLRKGLVDSRERAQAILDDLQEQPLPRRPGFALGVVALAVLLLGAGAFFFLRPHETTQASTDGPAQTGAIASNQIATIQPPAVPSSGGRTLRGVPDVIDTATLSLEGEVVRLFGVEWAPGAGKPDDLTQYLQGREVTCEPTGRNETYRCKVGDQDLSRVILYNGGGQPNSEATPELKAAAEKAREAKLGVWSKQP